MWYVKAWWPSYPTPTRSKNPCLVNTESSGRSTFSICNTFAVASFSWRGTGPCAPEEKPKWMCSHPQEEERNNWGSQAIGDKSYCAQLDVHANNLWSDRECQFFKFSSLRGTSAWAAEMKISIQQHVHCSPSLRGIHCIFFCLACHSSFDNRYLAITLFYSAASTLCTAELKFCFNIVQFLLPQLSIPGKCREWKPNQMF